MLYPQCSFAKVSDDFFWCFHFSRGDSLQQGLWGELLLRDGGTESVAHSRSWVVS